MTTSLAVDVQFRTYGFELEGVELVRAEGGDGREITGIAVPYGVDQQIYPGLIERFDRGSFDHQLRAIPQRTVFVRDHYSMGGTIIGKVKGAEDTAKGLRLHARVSQLRDPIADDTLTLIVDEVLRELSIGFIDRKSVMDGAVTVRRKADLTELAIVHRGAYGRNATVIGVRSEQVPNNRLTARQALARLPLPDMLS